MVRYGCSVHRHWPCSAQPVVGRESRAENRRRDILRRPSPQRRARSCRSPLVHCCRSLRRPLAGLFHRQLRVCRRRRPARLRGPLPPEPQRSPPLPLPRFHVSALPSRLPRVGSITAIPGARNVPSLLRRVSAAQGASPPAAPPLLRSMISPTGRPCGRPRPRGSGANAATRRDADSLPSTAPHPPPPGPRPPAPSNC